MSAEVAGRVQGGRISTRKCGEVVPEEKTCYDIPSIHYQGEHVSIYKRTSFKGRIQQVFGRNSLE
jgi:hypothetical protein